MIAAQNQRELLGGQGALHHLSQARAGLGYLSKIFRFGVAFGLTFALDHGDVSQVLHFVAQLRQANVEIRYANGGRSHVDAAAARAEVERDADDRDVGVAHLDAVAHALLRAAFTLV
jgi:hypothetical protein